MIKKSYKEPADEDTIVWSLIVMIGLILLVMLVLWFYPEIFN